MTDFSGQQLGQYELIELIGKGGMATVYRAIQRNMAREVAVKVIEPDLAEEAEFRMRFEREARIIAQLQHPNILEIHDFGRQGNLTYLVMRLMTGGSLKDELRAEPMSYERVLQITGQIASALNYAHGRGIVHRDLKPSNVLLDDDRNVALTDFGIAKMVGATTISDLTIAGEVMGTPKYMAPEQWRSEPVDGRADVYALGVLIYQMLTGQVPFSAQTPHSLMYQHLDRMPTPPHTIRPSLPLALGPVILKALAKNRDQRYDTAGELAADLHDALRRPDSPTSRTTQQTTWPPSVSRPVRPSREEDSPADLVDRADQPQRPRDAHRDPLEMRRPRPGEPDRVHNEDMLASTQSDRRAAIPPPRSSTPRPRPDRIPHSPNLPTSGYTAPYRPPAYENPPRPEPVRRLRPDEPGIGRFFGIMAAVIVALGLFFGIVFVIALLTTSKNTNDTTRAAPTSPPTAAPTTVPAGARPNAQITYPPNNTTVRLGDQVPIRFTATYSQPITRVELRWYNQIVAAIPANNATVFSGEFTFPVNTSGTHVLEVVPFSGEIEGNPARVTLTAR
jgi:serine/threonine protein kinase